MSLFNGAPDEASSPQPAPAQPVVPSPPPVAVVPPDVGLPGLTQEQLIRQQLPAKQKQLDQLQKKIKLLSEQIKAQLAGGFVLPTMASAATPAASPPPVAVVPPVVGPPGLTQEQLQKKIDLMLERIKAQLAGGFVLPTVASAGTPAASPPAASTPTASTPTASPPAASTPTASPSAAGTPTASPSAASPPAASPSAASPPAASTSAASPPAASPPTASPSAASPSAASTSAASTPTASPPAASTPAASTPTASPPAASTPAASPPAASTPTASPPAASPSAASSPVSSQSVTSENKLPEKSPRPDKPRIRRWDVVEDKPTSKSPSKSPSLMAKTVQSKPRPPGAKVQKSTAGTKKDPRLKKRTLDRPGEDEPKEKKSRLDRPGDMKEREEPSRSARKSKLVNGAVVNHGTDKLDFKTAGNACTHSRKRTRSRSRSPFPNSSPKRTDRRSPKSRTRSNSLSRSPSHKAGKPRRIRADEPSHGQPGWDDRQSGSRYDVPVQGGHPRFEYAPGHQGPPRFAPQHNMQPPMRPMAPAIYDNPIAPQQNLPVGPQRFPEPMNPQFPAGPMTFPAQPTWKLNMPLGPAFSQPAPGPFYNSAAPSGDLQQLVNLMGTMNQNQDQTFPPQNTAPFGQTSQAVPAENCFGQVDIDNLLSKLLSTGIMKPSQPESVRAKRDQMGELCEVSQEPFETYWVEEVEDWFLKNGVQVDDKNFHPTCFEDY